MAKTIKNSIKEVGLAKNQTWGAIEKADALYKGEAKRSYRRRWAELFMNECEHELNPNLAEDTEIETVEDFCRKHRIDRETLWAWSKEDPEFAKAYRYGKMLLANKDFKGIKHRKYEPSKTAMHLHTLDDKWKEIDRYHAALKNPDAEAAEGGFTYKGPLIKENNGSGVEDNSK